MNKKELVVKYRGLVSLACSGFNLLSLPRRRVKGTGNRIEAPCALLDKCTIRISGSGNRIVIGDFAVLKGVSIYISGDNNTVTIGSWSHLNGTEICMEDSGNTVQIGEKTRFLGKTHLAAIEGTNITIGNDCLFSGDVHFRTGDSHSVLDLQGRRINPSEDIALGDHVWVGTKVTCLKGARVASHSILAACALVTGKFDEPHCTLAGVPAKVVKRDVDWSILRVPVGEIPADYCREE